MLCDYYGIEINEAVHKGFVLLTLDKCASELNGIKIFVALNVFAKLCS